VLQCVAACCSVLQRVAACCSVLQCVAVCCSVLQCVAIFVVYTNSPLSSELVAIQCVLHLRRRAYLQRRLRLRARAPSFLQKKDSTKCTIKVTCTINST